MRLHASRLYFDCLMRREGEGPNLAPVEASGVRFTGNACFFTHLGDPVCEVASHPMTGGMEFLVKGFSFVEFDIDRSNVPLREGSGRVGQILRLSLVPRPDDSCKWEQLNWTGGTEQAIESLEKAGIPQDKCIATEWTSTPQATYRFVVSSIASENVRGKLVRKNSLERTSDGALVAEYWTGGIRGSEILNTGQYCKNYDEGKRLLALVQPSKSKRGGGAK